MGPLSPVFRRPHPPPPLVGASFPAICSQLFTSDRATCAEKRDKVGEERDQIYIHSLYRATRQPHRPSASLQSCLNEGTAKSPGSLLVRPRHGPNVNTLRPRAPKALGKTDNEQRKRNMPSGQIHHTLAHTRALCVHWSQTARVHQSAAISRRSITRGWKTRNAGQFSGRYSKRYAQEGGGKR